MKSAASFVLENKGASAAEFALVLPAFLLLFLGTIDVGRYMWNVGQLEKATMMGARYAVVTDMVPSGLADYKFAIDGGIPQGNPVPRTAFKGVTCSSENGAVTCACIDSAVCSHAVGQDADAFNNIVDRMRLVYGGLGSNSVHVDYTWSGLGYSGDPEGSDVDPIVTVRLEDVPFRPLILGTLRNTGLPGTSHSLTQEDGKGDQSF